MSSTSQNLPPAQLATAVFVFRQIICLLFITGWLVMFCFDTFFDTGEQLLPFWFNAIGMGVLAFSLGVNVESLMSYRGITIVPTTAEQSQPQPQYAQPTRPTPYVPPDAKR